MYILWSSSLVALSFLKRHIIVFLGFRCIWRLWARDTYVFAMIEFSCALVHETWLQAFYLILVISLHIISEKSTGFTSRIYIWHTRRRRYRILFSFRVLLISSSECTVILAYRVELLLRAVSLVIIHILASIMRLSQISASFTKLSQIRLYLIHSPVTSLLLTLKAGLTLLIWITGHS